MIHETEDNSKASHNLKGPYYYWSKNGSGANAWMKILIEHYANLSASYLQKGYIREAKLFSDIAEKFQTIDLEVKREKNKKTKLSND